MTINCSRIISHRPIAIVFMVFGFSFLVLLYSCGSQKEVAYISDADRDTAQSIITSYASTVHPGDRLYIYVASQTPESAFPFNEETNKNISSLGNPANPVDGYLVDQSGTILFPVLGRLTVAGLTYDSLAIELGKLLRDGGYISDAIVTVSLMNFRVAVIGEVAKPQELHVNGERLTIFEALAMCGDLTIHGLRDNITVIRHSSNPANNADVEVGQIDLTSKSLFDSPYYYLRQGDIVYVEPDKYRKRLASVNTKVPSYISLTVSAASLLMRLYRTYGIDRRGLFY